MTTKFIANSAATNLPSWSERSRSAAGTCRNVAYSSAARIGLIAALRDVVPGVATPTTIPRAIAAI